MKNLFLFPLLLSLPMTAFAGEQAQLIQRHVELAVDPAACIDGLCPAPLEGRMFLNEETLECKIVLEKSKHELPCDSGVFAPALEGTSQEAELRPVDSSWIIREYEDQFTPGVSEIPMHVVFRF